LKARTGGAAGSDLAQAFGKMATERVDLDARNIRTAEGAAQQFEAQLI
jgi:hypothetical protein